MSYSTGEAIVLAILRNMERYNWQNTSRGDWKLLNSGVSETYAIIKPGFFSNAWESIGDGGLVLTTWRTIIEVWQRWVDDGPTITALEERVSEVIQKFDGYPTLDGTALIAFASGGGEMQQRWVKDGGPVWAVQEIYFDWQEEREITIAE